MILRFYKLGAQSFWIDEVASINYAKRGVYGKGHPPLSFIILLYFIETFGETEFIARLPSYLFGIATIPLVYIFGKQLFSEKEGLVASFIMSISSWHIRWSQEARMYAQLTFFTLLALYFFYYATYNEHLPCYVFSSMATTLAYYTHFFAVFIPVIIVLWLIALRLFDKTRPHINFGHLVIFFVFFFVLCAPSFFTVIPEVIDFKLGGREVRWGAPTIEDFIVNMFIHEIGPFLFSFSVIGVVLTVLKRKNAGSMLISYAIIPLLTFSLLVPKMNIIVRYLLFTLPAYALFTAYLLIYTVEKIKSEVNKEFHSNALKKIINKSVSIGTILGLLFSMYTIPNLSYYYTYGVHPDWKAACLFVESEIKPKDIVVSTVSNTVEYYLGWCDYTLSDAIFGKIKNSKSRVWLLIEDWKLDVIDPDHEFQDWMNSHCKLMHQVYRIDIYMFDP